MAKKHTLSQGKRIFLIPWLGQWIEVRLVTAREGER